MRRIPTGRLLTALQTLGLLAVCSAGCDGEALTSRPRQRRTQVIGFASQGLQLDIDLLVKGVSEPDLPMDGLVVKFAEQPLPWSENPPTPQSLAQALADATSLAMTKVPLLRESFLQWQPAQDPEWGNSAFEERAVTAWAFAGRLISTVGLKGMFLDPIPYMYPVWRQPAGTTVTEARRVARQRGLVVGRGLYSQAPDAVVILALGYSEVFRQVCLGPNPVGLEASEYSLYPAFLDGLFAARDETKTRPQIIDAFLPSYITRTPEAFAAFRSLMHFRWDAVVAAWSPNIQTFFNADVNNPQVMNWPAKAPALACNDMQLLELARDVPAGTSIWLDAPAMLNDSGSFSATDLNRNWFTPTQATAALGAAAQATDNYIFVWLGSTSWFRSSTWPPLPTPYLEALEAARP